MTFVFSGYTVIYLLAALLSIVAAAFAHPNRAAHGGRWLLAMLTASIVWSLAEAVDFSVTALSAHILAAQFAYMAATVPVLYLLFALQYSGRWVRPKARWLVALFAVPAVSIAAAFTNGLHHLIWTGFVAAPGRPNLITYQHGPLYWVVAVYSLAVAMIATSLIIDMSLRARGLYRVQSIAIILAAVFPIGAGALYSFAPQVLHGLDPSIAFSVTGVVIAIAISRLRLFDLIPVPREVLFEEMTDGVAILDHEGRVIEMNPAAVRLLGLKRAPVPGTIGADVFADWSDAGRDAVTAVYEGRSMTLESPAGTVIGVERSRLAGANESQTRDLFILRDITAQVRAEGELRDTYVALETRMAEIQALQQELLEQATRDPLTGLHNRRYLAEELERELGRAAREQYPVSVVMFDVDHFKSVNDSCGHAAGDDVLRTIAEVLVSETRRGDVTCRYGGDEFVVVLPNATMESALLRAEGWRLRLREAAFEACAERVMPTVSLGVATYPAHGATIDTLVAAADRAVYTSKAGGRDRVSVAPETPADQADGPRPA